MTRKITRAVAAIHLGLQDRLFIGNLDAKRDWGHARDFVRGMWMMLQQDEPDDYVLATNVMISVRSFVEKAFRRIGIDLVWRGTGVEETGADKETGRILVQVDPRYFRPTEVEILLGDSTKAREKLGWQHTVDVDTLLAEMVREDLKVMARLVPPAGGNKSFGHG